MSAPNDGGSATVGCWAIGVQHGGDHDGHLFIEAWVSLAGETGRPVRFFAEDTPYTRHMSAEMYRERVVLAARGGK